MQIQLLRADVSSLNVDALVSPPDSVGSGESAGGNLLCKFVIRAEVPSAGTMTDEDLRRATTRALEKAEELAVGSVGLPPLRNAGGSEADLHACANAMVRAALDFRPRARSLRRLVFCLFGKAPHEAFKKALTELER